LAEIGTTGGFTSTTVVGPIVIGIALVAVFVRHALRARHPLLNVRLYAKPVFAAASLTAFGVSMALFGAVILMPLYFQQVRGYDVLVTGLLVAPGAIGGAMAMPISGRLTDRVGGGPIALAGVTVTGLGTIPLALMGTDTSLWVIGAAQLVRGVGIGLALVPTMSAALAAVRPDELSDASPQMSVIQRVSGAIGTAILAVVLQRSISALGHPLSHAGLASAFDTAFWWTLGITLLAAAPSLLLIRAEGQSRRAQSTTHPR